MFFSLIRYNGLNPARRLICLLRFSRSTVVGDDELFKFLRILYLLCIILLREWCRSWKQLVAWASNGYARFPFCFISLWRITMKVQQTESASTVHHIVNARRFLLPSTLSSASSISLSSCIPPRSLSRSDPLRRKTRLYSSYFPRVSRSARYSSCRVFVASLRPPLIFRAPPEAFANGKYIPGECRRSDRIFASVVWEHSRVQDKTG